MARLTAQEKLERAKEAKARAEAEIRSLAARARQDDRKKDTRRKILIGGLFLQAMQSNPNMKDWLMARIQNLPERDRSAFEGWDQGHKNKERGDDGSVT